MSTEVPVNIGPGWYEFFHVIKATTHIAYIFENGDLYLPEEGLTYDDFIFASSRGKVYKLVRAEDMTAHPIGMDGKSV